MYRMFFILRYTNLKTFIQKVDVAKLLYLYRYGGLYVDMDYVPVRDHTELFNDKNFTK